MPAQAALLVVDDNDDNRYTLTRHLNRSGYANLTTAADGREALVLLHQRPFDLVLLDIMMPGMNGYEVLEHLKNDPQLRHIPVIMISAVDEIESVIRCVELGADDLVKRLGRLVAEKLVVDHTRSMNQSRERTVALSPAAERPPHRIGVPDVDLGVLDDRPVSLQHRDGSRNLRG